MKPTSEPKVQHVPKQLSLCDELNAMALQIRKKDLVKVIALVKQQCCNAIHCNYETLSAVVTLPRMLLGCECIEILMSQNVVLSFQQKITLSDGVDCAASYVYYAYWDHKRVANAKQRVALEKQEKRSDDECLLPTAKDLD